MKVKLEIYKRFLRNYAKNDVIFWKNSFLKLTSKSKKFVPKIEKKCTLCDILFPGRNFFYSFFNNTFDSWLPMSLLGTLLIDIYLVV